MTLFLDEVSNISLETQGKLLRVLETGEFRPVGSEDMKKTNIRLICATNRDLKLMIDKEKFREDLFYRLNVVTILVPPLRERIEDIPFLAQHFLKMAVKRANKDVRGFPPAALHRLVVNPWPGNVRELENANEKAVVLSRQDMITPDLLPSVSVSAEAPLKPLTEAKEEFERTYLKNVLQLTGQWDWNCHDHGHPAIGDATGRTSRSPLHRG